MARWTCPYCDREFDRVHQAHVCVPGGSVDECFAGRPPVQRTIYRALIDHLRSLGPVHEDAVGVGVFLKHASKLAEVRPKARSLSLGVVLPRAVDDPRIARRIQVSADRIAHIIKLTDTADVDEQILDWLTEAYHAAA